MRGRVSARAVDLGPGPDAVQVLGRVADWPGLVCLIGQWTAADDAPDGAALLTSHPLQVLGSGADPLAALDDQPEVVDADSADIVGGGWFGRLAFDGESALAFHDHVLRLVDGRWQFEALYREDRAEALAERLEAWRAALAAAGQPGLEQSKRAPYAVTELQAPRRAAHLGAVERGVELIRAGELYQLNVCTRFRAKFGGSPAQLFADAVSSLRPRYAAYLAANPAGGSEGGTGTAVLSLSPELFLRRRGRDVITSPIKGTLPRGPGAPANNDAALRRSVKDVAENVMIVDLVRNDLGRVCEIGSVRPLALLDVQPHPGVWHLVSTVGGTLRSDAHDGELLAATFPPGSVTGAPKLSAMRAIAALEAQPRGTYTGAVGFAAPSWGAQFNVAIRTFEIADGRIELGVGGGITVDSVPMLEWRECLHKAAPLLRVAGVDVPEELPAASVVPAADALLRTDALLRGGLLETVLVLAGEPVRLGDHVARLDRSCRELYGSGLPGDAVLRARAAAAGAATHARAVLRIIVRPEAELTLEIAAAPPRPAPLRAATCVRPNGVWRHKWADRSWAAAHENAIFVAADGTVLETTRGNVFLVDADGTVVTPPLRDDLLPGVTRRALLDLLRDRGHPTALREFGVEELRSRPAFWTSSLSLAVPISDVDGASLPRVDELVADFASALRSTQPALGTGRHGGDQPVR